MSNKINNSNGFIALVSVVVLAAIITSVTVSILLLGVESIQGAQTITNGTQARGLATLCAERALEEIRQDDGYTGTDNIAADNGSCMFMVTSTGGENREIESTGVSGLVTRRVEITIDQIYPTIHIVSWQEVAAF